MLNITFTINHLPQAQAIAILINEQLKLDNNLMMLLDQQYYELILKTIQNKLIFSANFGQTKILTLTNKNGNIRFLLIVGIGDEKKLKSTCFEQLGGKIFTLAKSIKAEIVEVMTPNNAGGFDQDTIASLVGSGAILSSYKFDKYFTKQKDEDKFQVKKVGVLSNDPALAEGIFIQKKAIAAGVFLARDCINEPPNVLYPKSYSQIIVDKLERLGVKVEVLGEQEMQNLGMNALIGVGRGSQNESKFVIMKYDGGGNDSAPIALVGKGVTFDTGGISLKPLTSMVDMKYDMAGSAAVVGTIKALALRKAKVNVVGVVGLVENMPSGNAQRPGDVVTTMSGKTAEVLDTDAEGRLVLADAIWYVQNKFNPTCVIDLATLTGAIVVALGSTYAGLFANNDDLADKLIKAGLSVNEKLWRMPLHKDYDEMIKSDIADVANLGNIKGAAGSSTAAHFIGHFIKEGVKWAHLDIAGMVQEKNGTAICPKGAIGYGVRLLNQFIKENYESQ